MRGSILAGKLEPARAAGGMSLRVLQLVERSLLPAGPWSWRLTALALLLAWGVAVVVLTETLSLFGMLRPGHVTILWTLAACATIAYIFGALRAGRLRWPPVTPPRSMVTVLVIALGVLAALVGISALVGAPNQGDVHVYHLPRVMHWQQNGNVGFYQTGILRQLFQAPGAEFAILHLYLVTGSDQFFNMVSWVGLVGSLIGVSLIA